MLITATAAATVAGRRLVPFVVGVLEKLLVLVFAGHFVHVGLDVNDDETRTMLMLPLVLLFNSIIRLLLLLNIESSVQNL